MKVTEIAKTLGVSPRTIYRRIETLSLGVKGHVSQVGKVKSVDSEGVELIRASLGESCHSDMAEGVATTVTTKIDDRSTVESYKTLLLEQKQLYEKLLLEKDQSIENLRKEKDVLIKDLRKDKDRLMQMTENSQVLLKLEQEKVLQLQELPVKKTFWEKFKKTQPD